MVASLGPNQESSKGVSQGVRYVAFWHDLLTAESRTLAPLPQLQPTGNARMETWLISPACPMMTVPSSSATSTALSLGCIVKQLSIMRALHRLLPSVFGIKSHKTRVRRASQCSTDTPNAYYYFGLAVDTSFNLAVVQESFSLVEQWSCVNTAGLPTQLKDVSIVERSLGKNCPQYHGDQSL